MGTLFELGNCSLDVLRHLVDRPAGQSLTLISRVSDNLKPLDVGESVSIVRRNLEAVVFYAVTQLAMWLAKPELDAGIHDMETEERLLGETQISEKERRAGRRRSMTMAERLRRGMTGEMAADLQALLTRAKPVMAKSAATVGGNQVDLTAVLSRFVQERILVPN